MPEIRLIATDLDGTLLGSANDFPLYASFRDRVQDMRQKSDGFWVACTGRPLASFKRVFSPMRALGLEPDFIIVSHAFIFSLTPFGYVPHLVWSLRVRWRMWRNGMQVRQILRDWHRTLVRMTMGSRTLLRKPDRLMLHFESEASAKVAARLLEERITPTHCVHVFQYRNHVDARPVPFTKGLALAELAQSLGVPRERVLAIGNGYNDMSMLDGTVAGMTGCPANSEAEVMQTVQRSRGHIASTSALAGVLEVIDAFTAGHVNSELPGSWRDPSEQEAPEVRKQRHSSRESTRGCLGKSLFFVAVVYTVLLAFANFGLLPFSGLIMKPYNILLRLVTRLVASF